MASNSEATQWMSHPFYQRFRQCASTSWPCSSNAASTSSASSSSFPTRLSQQQNRPEFSGPGTSGGHGGGPPWANTPAQQDHRHMMPMQQQFSGALPNRFAEPNNGSDMGPWSGPGPQNSHMSQTQSSPPVPCNTSVPPPVRNQFWPQTTAPVDTSRPPPSAHQPLVPPRARTLTPPRFSTGQQPAQTQNMVASEHVSQQNQFFQDSNKNQFLPLQRQPPLEVGGGFRPLQSNSSVDKMSPTFPLKNAAAFAGESASVVVPSDGEQKTTAGGGGGFFTALKKRRVIQSDCDERSDAGVKRRAVGEAPFEKQSSADQDERQRVKLMLEQLKDKDERSLQSNHSPSRRSSGSPRKEHHKSPSKKQDLDERPASRETTRKHDREETKTRFPSSRKQERETFGKQHDRESKTTFPFGKSVREPRMVLPSRKQDLESTTFPRKPNVETTMIPRKSSVETNNWDYDSVQREEMPPAPMAQDSRRPLLVYSDDIWDSQNNGERGTGKDRISPPYAKLCDVCDIKYSGKAMMLSHLSGKKHKRMLERKLLSALSLNTQIQSPASSIEDKVDSPALLESEAGPSGLTVFPKIIPLEPQEPSDQELVLDPYYCALCRVSCVSAWQLNEHMSGKKHIKKASLQKQSMPGLCCDLCNIQSASMTELQKHLSSDTHLDAVFEAALKILELHDFDVECLAKLNEKLEAQKKLLPPSAAVLRSKRSTTTTSDESDFEIRQLTIAEGGAEELGSIPENVSTGCDT